MQGIYPIYTMQQKPTIYFNAENHSNSIISKISDEESIHDIFVFVVHTYYLNAGIHPS